VFEEAASGKMKMFDANSDGVAVLADNFIGLPRECIWDEGKATVVVHFFGDRPARTFEGFPTNR
jgi:hypothetical protein